jgi:hypothetical protein
MLEPSYLRFKTNASLALPLGGLELTLLVLPNVVDANVGTEVRKDAVFGLVDNLGELIDLVCESGVLSLGLNDKCIRDLDETGDRRFYYSPS